jgi:hypothetical protein
MADDVLANLTPAGVAAFYSRLADGVDARPGKHDVSVAALLGVVVEHVTLEPSVE